MVLTSGLSSHIAAVWVAGLCWRYGKKGDRQGARVEVCVKEERCRICWQCIATSNG